MGQAVSTCKNSEDSYRTHLNQFQRWLTLFLTYSSIDRNAESVNLTKTSDFLQLMLSWAERPYCCPSTRAAILSPSRELFGNGGSYETNKHKKKTSATSHQSVISSDNKRGKGKNRTQSPSKQIVMFV